MWPTSKRPHRERWLEDLHAGLSDGDASEVIVPGEQSSTHVRITKEDMERFFSSQKKRFKLQGRFYQSIVCILLFGIGAVLLDAFSEKIDEVVASDEYARIQTERDAMEEALTLYTEFTRDIVEDHHGDLSARLGTLGTDTTTVVRTTSATPGTGGLSSHTEGVGRMLAEYVDDQTARSLHEIARVEEFLDRLPASEPLQGSHLTSGFGMREHPVTGHVVPHRGIDLVSWEQPTVLAAGPGRVTFAGKRGKSGNMVTVDHGSAIESLYLHLDSIAVEAGAHVEAGEALGIMGDTGETDGAHLHYEVRVAGKHLDPVNVFEVLGHGE